MAAGRKIHSLTHLRPLVAASSFRHPTPPTNTPRVPVYHDVRCSMATHSGTHLHGSLTAADATNPVCLPTPNSVLKTRVAKGPGTYTGAVFSFKLDIKVVDMALETANKFNELDVTVSTKSSTLMPPRYGTTTTRASKSGQAWGYMLCSVTLHDA